MNLEYAKSLLEPMSPETTVAVAQAVRESAADVAGGRPSEGGFIADVHDSAVRVIQGTPTLVDLEMVLDCYLEVVLADATTAEEILNEHRKVVAAYTE